MQRQHIFSTQKTLFPKLRAGTETSTIVLIFMKHVKYVVFLHSRLAQSISANIFLKIDRTFDSGPSSCNKIDNTILLMRVPSSNEKNGNKNKETNGKEEIHCVISVFFLTCSCLAICTGHFP